MNKNIIEKICQEAINYANELIKICLTRLSINSLSAERKKR